MSNTDIQELIDAHKKFEDFEFSDQHWNKVAGSPQPGGKVSIHWGGKILKDVVDEGYCFMLPMCNDDWEMYDFFVHAPKPENPGGIGDAPQEFVHIGDLITNRLVKKIVFEENISDD